MTTLPCIRCGKKLETAIPRVVQDDMPDWQPDNQPSAGTTFKSRGQYGSTVWDPDGLSPYEFLEINVCDECMVAAGREGRILRGVPRPQPAPRTELWDVSRLAWCEHCGSAVLLPHDKHYDEVPF